MKGASIMMGFGYGYGGFGGCGLTGGGFGMMIIPLILIGIIIYAIFKMQGSNAGNRVEYNNSIEILNERYARGEITEDEYKQKKSLILRH